MNKIQIKSLLRKQYNAIKSACSERINLDNIYNVINRYNPDIIGLYKSMYGEVDISLLHNIFPKKTFGYPRISDNIMYFIEVNQNTDFVKNQHYHFLEPASNKIVLPNMIFIPGKYFDPNGYRVGFGKGHYDRYISNANKLGLRKKLIGLCLQENMLNSIPNEATDCRMDYVLYGNKIIKI